MYGSRRCDTASYYEDELQWLSDMKDEWEDVVGGGLEFKEKTGHTKRKGIAMAGI